MAQKRHRFGKVVKQRSGRYQASYIGPDGERHHAPKTFERESDGRRWLVDVESRLQRGEWVNPERAKIKLAVYGPKWVEERPKLRPRTRKVSSQVRRFYGDVGAVVGAVSGLLIHTVSGISGGVGRFVNLSGCVRHAVDRVC